MSHPRRLQCCYSLRAHKSFTLNVEIVTSLYLTFVGPCIVNVYLSSANKMQRYTIFFYCLQCSACFMRFFHSSSGAQKLCVQHQYLSDLFAMTASLGESERLTQPSGHTKQVWQVPDAARTVSELLTMSGKTTRNMQSTDNNKRVLCNAASCWLSLSIVTPVADDSYRCIRCVLSKRWLSSCVFTWWNELFSLCTVSGECTASSSG